MSCTLTAACVDDGELTAVHVGDSRLYLIRDGEATQLTKDHTVAAEKVRMKLLSKEKARFHPDRSVLTRSLGRELILSRDRITQRVYVGDVLLLCSDGLTRHVSDERIRDVLRSMTSAKQACETLLQEALDDGGTDNITVIVGRAVPRGSEAA